MNTLLLGNALFALAAAGLWGIGDFSGVMASRSAGGTMRGALRVILLGHAISLSVLLAIAFARGDAFPHGLPLACGLAAGVVVGLSLSAFYVALSRGAIGASAAISGLLAAAIPSLFALHADGTPGWRKGIGFLVAGAAIWLIAAGESVREAASTTWLAIVSGAGFGVYFVLLKYAGAAGVVWPMANSRMGSVTTCAILLAATGFTREEAVPISRKIVAWVLATALFDTSGNLMFVAATRAGRLDVAAVLGSLYPASTILLAALVVRERPTRRQIAGMAVAALAVVLIAA